MNLSLFQGSPLGFRPKMVNIQKGALQNGSETESM